MRSELEQWQAGLDQPITAANWNGWLETLERLMPEPGRAARRRAGIEDHPFRVDPARWESELASPPDRLWRVDVSPGCCNDQPATILYRRRDDPRGWKVPSADWATPGLPVPAASAPALAFVDRSLLEVGGDDPPFLLLTTPPAGAATDDPAEDFRLWTSSRPTFFQQDEYKDRRLWYASVTLSADPLHAFPLNITGPARTEIAAKLPQRFRLRAGRAPVSTAGLAGGAVEIARVWLLRDLTADDVLAADELLVQQRVYTHLQAVIVAPGLTVEDGSIIGDLTQELVNAALEAASGQEFWSG